MPDTGPGTAPNTPANAKKNSAQTSQPTVRDPDPLQKGMLDFWGWVEEHAKLIAALIVVLILGAVAYIALQSFKGYQERTAQKSYYDVEAKYTKIKDGFDRAKFKAMAPEAAAKDAKNDDKPSTGDLDKDYGTIPSELEKVARDHAGTAAGAQAAILAGDLYLQYNQPDKAIAIAQIPVKSMSDRDLLASLSKVLLGNAMSAKGDCQGAVGIWQQVLSNKSATYLHGDVGLRSGICYEQMGDTGKAAEMYRKVTAEAADSSAAATAKGLLRAVELKKTPAAQPAKQG